MTKLMKVATAKIRRITQAFCEIVQLHEHVKIIELFVLSAHDANRRRLKPASRSMLAVMTT